MPWLIVLNNANAAQWVLDSARMAFRPNVPAGRLSVGDPVALYLTSAASRGEPRIVGLGRIASAVREERLEIGGKEFARSCDLNIKRRLPLERGLPFRPLVYSMRFIKHKHAWSSSMYRTLVEIPDEDFERIGAAFERHAALGAE